MSKIKKLVGLGIVAVIIGAFLWFSPTIISFVQNPSSSTSYTSVTVRSDVSGVKYDLGYNWWVFSYGAGQVWAYDATMKTRGFFNLTVGTTYTWDGLEIKVSEVYPAYAVLLVKPVS